MAEFFASKDWQTFLDVLPSIPAETWDTFYSTVVATLFALVIGLPLGVLLVTGEPGGVRPLPRWVMRLLNGVINLLRSVPFLILMIIVIPLSRLIVGTSIGTVASIVPLVIASFPFVSRLVETSIREVDSGVVEAAQSMGATPLQIITKVLIPESMPSLIANATIAATTILGYGAMAGVIGIIRSSSIIKQALGLAVSELGGKKKGNSVVERTQRDISMKFILSGIISVLIATFVFFQFGVLGNLTHTIIATLIVFVISFLFTTVAANAIAIVGSNPVSGMTLMTLILSSLVLVSAGLSGTSGMMAAMIIGGVVCTALSMAGGFITDLKIGYWLGTTPARQEGWKFLGTAVSAATIAGVMMVLNQTYGFVGENALVAPQANAMAAVIKPLMEGGATPWLLYFAGAALALILTMIGVPALAFALGMFIPLDLNTPLLIGGLISWYVGTRSKDENVNKARRERGTLIASGFIAGGALMGVVSAILKYCGADWFISWSGAEVLAVVMYILIILYFIYDSMKAKLAD